MGKGHKLSHLALAGLAAGLAGLQACNKGQGGSSNRQDTTPAVEAAEAFADTAAARHACRGLNQCKGQGGCAVTGTQLEGMAAKAGILLEKAGAPHDCKGKNECKGLGGCNM